MNELITNFMHLYKTVATILLLISLLAVLTNNYELSENFRPTARLAFKNAFWLTLYILSWYY